MTMTKGPWDGDWRLSTTWRYSDGALHAAWDVAMPRGTRLYAPGDGVVVDCNDGQPDPAPKRYSGMPSNWIILKYTAPSGPYKGKTLYSYWQHLTKGGVKVRRGQKVKRGQLIGLSGSSGNSSGPHLHLVVLKPGYTMSRSTRYRYMQQTGSIVWQTDKAWGKANYGAVYVYADKLKPGVKNSRSVRMLRKALIHRGLMPPGTFTKTKPGNDYTNRVVIGVKAWQKKKGYKQTGVLTKKQTREFFEPNSRVKVVT